MHSETLCETIQVATRGSTSACFQEPRVESRSGWGGGGGGGGTGGHGFVSCEFSGRGSCDGPKTRPRESYQMWYI